MRRVLIQVHLWMGLALGLYVLMMSVTGSAIVARREITRIWLPDTVAAAGRAALDEATLRGRAQAQLPQYRLVSVHARRTRPALPPGELRPVEIEFRDGGRSITHRFDPFTGRDMGDIFPRHFQMYLAVVALHDDLLVGRRGRVVNGAAAVAITLLLLTGIVIWWPVGSRRWRSSLWITRGSPPRTQLRQLHNMLGIWPLLLLLLWTLSGIYFGFPDLFEQAKNLLFPPGTPRAPTGDVLLDWLARLHFGRFGGAGVRTLWIVLGLVPGALFVTGAIMWWHSVLRPALRRRRARPPA